MKMHQASQNYSIEDYENELNNKGLNHQSKETKFVNTIHYKMSLFLREEII